MGALKLAEHPPVPVGNGIQGWNEIRIYATPIEAGTLDAWREFGKGMGQSQREMAAMARTSQGYISKLEAGWLTPKRSKWEDLMKAYEIRSEAVWLKLLNATIAARVLKTPATESEPLLVGSVGVRSEE